jgi:hypothetical protein
MTSLVPCPSCARHVRVEETRCPFCDGPLPARAPVAARGPSAPGRLSRAALFAAGATLAGAAGCSSDSIGVAADAGVDRAGASDTGGADGAGDDMSAVPIYGAAINGAVLGDGLVPFDPDPNANAVDKNPK